jgi:hydrogenase nickel incorporation protein HypA/HybF
MHELAVTKSILQLVLDETEKNQAKEILKIQLVIGEMRNLEEEWIQRYFDYISKGTIAEHAVIKVRKVPVLFECKLCGEKFSADVHLEEKILCPKCKGFNYDLVAGRELVIENIEVR